MSASDSEPLLTLPARLGWKLSQSFIYGDVASNQPTEQELKFIPALECGLELAGKFEDIVLDLKALIASAVQPGGYFLLNCECGCPDDCEIEEMIFVHHPNEHSIVWELDVQGLRTALIKEDWLTHQSGYVRLVFDREQYEADLRRMMVEVKQANTLLELYGLAPGDYGFTEYLLVTDVDLPFVVEPILPPGSHLEFRLEGSALCWLDGKRWNGWPSRFFPCWQVNQAFKKWIEFAQRGYAIKDAAQPSKANYLYLLDENSRAACDAAGNELVQKLCACINQGVNFPKITVSYSSCALPAICKDNNETAGTPDF